MFISVKNLTTLIDNDIQFYIEGVASKEAHTVAEFDKWHIYITNLIYKRFNKLKEISTNQKLIDSYENKINELFNK